MEKGFNDDELADIMSEIESLEQEFAEDSELNATSDEMDNNDFTESYSDDMESQEEQEEEEIHAQTPEEPVMVEEEHEPTPEEPVMVEEEHEPTPEEPVMVEEEHEPTPEEPVMVEEEHEPAPEEPVMVEEEHEPAPEEPVMLQEKHEPPCDPAPLIKEEMTGVLAELTNMPVEDVHMSSHPMDDTNIHHMRREDSLTVQPPHSLAQNSAPNSMSFSVSGDIKVDLNFNVGGARIEVSVNEHEGLVITMDGGGKFILPIHSNSIKRAS